MLLQPTKAGGLVREQAALDVLFLGQDESVYPGHFVFCYFMGGERVVLRGHE